MNIKKLLPAVVILSFLAMFTRPTLGQTVQYGPGVGRPAASPVGKTFADVAGMGFEYEVGGVLLGRDLRPEMWDEQRECYPEIDRGREYLCLTFVSTDTGRPRNSRHFHIFLTLHDRDTGTFRVMDELDIDRRTRDDYLYEEVRYDFGGREHSHSALVRVDPRNDAVKGLFLVDPDNLCFIYADPYPGIRVEWQEP